MIQLSEKFISDYFTKYREFWAKKIWMIFITLSGAPKSDRL
tara:strand:- start:1709 stop:1831 length:123 start_codon:yes stop_codon:yes gene_type:complete